MPLNFIKIPHISDPNIIKNITYIDLGNEDNPKEYVSYFNWGSGEYKNIVRYGRSICEKRYRSDIEFLRKHDLDLINAVF